MFSATRHVTYSCFSSTSVNFAYRPVPTKNYVSKVNPVDTCRAASRRYSTDGKVCASTGRRNTELGTRPHMERIRNRYRTVRIFLTNSRTTGPITNQKAKDGDLREVEVAIPRFVQKPMRENLSLDFDTRTWDCAYANGFPF